MFSIRHRPVPGGFGTGPARILPFRFRRQSESILSAVLAGQPLCEVVGIPPRNEHSGLAVTIKRMAIITPAVVVFLEISELAVCDLRFAHPEAVDANFMYRSFIFSAILLGLGAAHKKTPAGYPHEFEAADRLLPCFESAERLFAA